MRADKCLAAHRSWRVGLSQAVPPVEKCLPQLSFEYVGETAGRVSGLSHRL
jgi:hypothetical protein